MILEILCFMVVIILLVVCVILYKKNKKMEISIKYNERDHQHQLKEKDRLLTKKDNKFKVTFENIPDYVIILERDENKELIVSEVSQLFTKEFGISQSKLINKKYSSLSIFPFGSEYEDDYMKKLNKIFDKLDSIYSFDVSRKTPKGLKYYSEKAFTVKNGKDRVVIIGRDDRFRHLLDNVSELVFQLTPELDIQYVSKGIKDLLGYTYKEVVGNNLKMYTRPDVAEAIQNNVLRKSLLRDISFGFRIMPLFKIDGSEGMFSVHTRLEYNDSGCMIGVIGSVREVTQEKLDEIKKSQQMETMLLSFSHSLDNIDKKIKSVRKGIDQ